MLAPAMARLKGLEPLAHCLEGSCSIHLSYKRIKKEKTGAGDGNRTHTTSLEGWDSAIELHPHKSLPACAGIRKENGAGGRN